MRELADRVIRMAASRRGYRLEQGGFPPDIGGTFLRHHDVCKPYTMTTTERLYALAEGVRFVVRANIPGDFVECGVWKGGSALMIALTLQDEGVSDRPIWLYDTFAGMVEPSPEDGASVHTRWAKQERGDHNGWCFSPIQEVKQVMARSTYPAGNLRFVAGKVEDTIPAQAPGSIALLRLDTDWYESTLHELAHLWPRLSPGGVLVIDDYGHWEGARRAVDEFFDGTPILMHRIDYTGRVVQKPNDAR